MNIAGIRSLVLEVTRRCNMRCDHCMRGEAQVLDMNLEIIDKLFASGIEFSDVTFTGGDPSLYPEAIQHFVKAMKFYGRTISHFYVKTNGKKESSEMAMSLLELYTMCDEPEMCQLDVSRDQFHEGYNEPDLYQGLRFYTKGSNPDDYRSNEYSNDQIINEGLAFDNGWGGTPQRESEVQFEEWDEDTYQVEQLQVAANGNICGQCDISFEREDEESVGNILEEDIHVILNRAYEAQSLKEAA